MRPSTPGSAIVCFNFSGALACAASVMALQPKRKAAIAYEARFLAKKKFNFALAPGRQANQ